MKNKVNLKILIPILLLVIVGVILALIFILGGNKDNTTDPDVPEHVCAFNKQVVNEDYKFSDATCKDRAKYFYSCECGKKGTTTFSTGNVADHEYVDGTCEECGELKPSDGLEYKLINNDTEYEVSRGTCTDSAVVIPATYKGLPVTKIATFGFSIFEKPLWLESIVIPDSITEIGEYAFSRCQALKFIVLPKSLTRIENSAFVNCVQLERIEYKGSCQEWNKISKGDSWKNNVKATHVICLDGQVKISF